MGLTREGTSRLRLVGAGVVVASLVALLPARADAGATYVHSARGGTLDNGRLTLRGVGRKVTWFTNGARAGRAPIRFVHKRAFASGKAATGVLHIAGQRGGEEQAFTLSAPRYDADRGTASYRARRLGQSGQASASAAAVRRRFGAASLSIAPGAPASGSPGSDALGSGDGGNHCPMILDNAQYGNGYGNINLVSASKWDTDDWSPAPPPNILLGQHPFVGSVGGFLRGCSNTTVWNAGTGDHNSNMTITITYAWSTVAPYSTCTSSNPSGMACVRADQGGEIIWRFQPV